MEQLVLNTDELTMDTIPKATQKFILYEAFIICIILFVFLLSVGLLIKHIKRKNRKGIILASVLIICTVIVYFIVLYANLKIIIELMISCILLICSLIFYKQK